MTVEAESPAPADSQERRMKKTLKAVIENREKFAKRKQEKLLKKIDRKMKKMTNNVGKDAAEHDLKTEVKKKKGRKHRAGGLRNELKRLRREELESKKAKAESKRTGVTVLPKQQKKLLKKQKREEARADGVFVDEKKKAKILRRLKSAQSKCKLSIAVPGSILDNAQSLELRTYLAGQIARAAAIYKVDEVIIFNDQPRADEETQGLEDEDEFTGLKHGKAGVHLARVLQYLECPQYLRKALFPVHPDLKYAGLLNPLDAPHHLRRHEQSKYREGVATKLKCNDGTYVDVGLEKPVKVDLKVEPGTRVTCELGPKVKPEEGGGSGRLVSPRTPREESGLYWGYEVRYESGGLSKVFRATGEKYDVRIGTSERGTNVEEMDLTLAPVTRGDDVSRLPHKILLVLGGVEGLEFACRNDPKLIKVVKKLKAKRRSSSEQAVKQEEMEVDEDVKKLKVKRRSSSEQAVKEEEMEVAEDESVDPRDLFDHYVNVCPDQGSRTIRTEEALLISLAAIVPKINAVFQDWESWV